MQKQEEKSTSPGVWSALASGFDLTAKHPWLLLLPILIDVFIWLGPRLRFQAIIEQLVANLPAEVETMDITQQLIDCQGALRIRNAAELEQAVGRLGHRQRIVIERDAHHGSAHDQPRGIVAVAVAVMASATQMTSGRSAVIAAISRTGCCTAVEVSLACM